MAEQLKSAEIGALIAPCFARLLQEFRDSRPNINDAVELLRKLNASTSLANSYLAEMQTKATSRNKCFNLGLRDDAA